MANPDHVKTVLKGNDAVSAWREQHPEERLDLRRAEFVRKNLNSLCLRDANLEWADLRWSDLIGTDLTGANLKNADLHKAAMRGAVLSRADLTGTNFEDADLCEAKFDEAVFKHTRLLNTTLSRAVGLLSATHAGPSTLDDETVAKSGDIPREFLEGCGLFLPVQATVYRVVIASPGDVSDERMRAREAIHSWSEQNTRTLRVVLQPVMWELHATPELGEHPQAIINRQLVDAGDILVCLFWSRLGSPTPEAESGTVEEIRRFLDSGKPVLVYFCKRSLPHDVDTQQLERLRAFGKEIRSKGLVDEFKKLDDLEQKLQRHLTTTVNRLSGQTSENGVLEQEGIHRPETGPA